MLTIYRVNDKTTVFCISWHWGILCMEVYIYNQDIFQFKDKNPES